MSMITSAWNSRFAIIYSNSTGSIYIYMSYMLFAGWEVRILKNCDRGLEFSRPRSQFFMIRTDPKAVNNLFIFFLLG